ncbi:hypothetical protein A2U01_0078990, partial [Trifolium medium]|nr:hypothetical protein [Trifolium medium]
VPWRGLLRVLLRLGVPECSHMVICMGSLRIVPRPSSSSVWIPCFRR